MKRLFVFFLVFFVASFALAEKALINWEWVNVRSGPNKDSSRVGRLVEGAEAEVVERDGDWLKIAYPGGEGWIASNSVTISALASPERSVEPAAKPLAEPPLPSPLESGAVAESEGAGPPVAATTQTRPEKNVGPPHDHAATRGGYLSEYNEPETAPISESAGSALVRMFSGLLAVLGLIGGAVWLSRKFLGGRFQSDRRGRGIQILASRAIGSRQGLLLAEAGGMVWLLAQSPDSVSLVAEIKDPDALRRLNESYEFLDSPFEAELRRRLDLESKDIFPADASLDKAVDGAESETSTEDRLAALRSRRNRRENP